MDHDVGLEALDDSPPPVEGGVIAGRAQDFEGLPLVGVRVEAAASGDESSLDALPVLTDGEGAFRLEGLVAHAYDLRFAMGTVKARVLGVPIGKEDLAVRLARPQGFVVDARVRPGDTPPEVLHLQLERRGKDGWVREHVGRSLRKRLLLWNLRPGTYRLFAWAPPWRPVLVEGIDVKDLEAARDVVLDLAARGERLAGTLLGPDGQPASGELTWRRDDGGVDLPLPFRSVSVGDDGRWRVEGLMPGRYVVSAVTDGGHVHVEAMSTTAS
ncbi:MAG: carboxypeptidase-like regulatory domain-containing protein [Planctomycetota bacterium]